MPARPVDRGLGGNHRAVALGRGTSSLIHLARRLLSARPMIHRRRTLPAALTSLAAGLAAVLGAADARAGDTWTTPHPGIRHLFRTTSKPLRMHALVVDLCTPGVGLRATASDERKRTPSSFGKLVKAEAAINGDFFSYATYATSG